MTLSLPRRSLLLAVVVAVLTGLAAVAVPARADAATSATTMEWQFFSKLNAYRAQNGRAPLRMSTAAANVARSWSGTMARADSLYHNPSMVGDLEHVAPHYRTVGENVGYGWSVDSLHDAFVNSAGHRANMVDSRYDYVGIGVVLSGTKIWVTVDFIDTSDRLTASAAPVADPAPGSPSTTAAPVPLGASLFLRASGGRTVRSSFSSGRVSGAENLGGVSRSAPATTSYGSWTAVAVRGTNNAVYIRTGTPGHYSPWHSLGGATYYGPALAGDASGRLDVFVTGTTRQLYVRSYVPGHGWTGWRSLGGALTTGPGAVTTSTGRTDVFGAGTDRAVWTRSRSGAGWARWHSLGGATASAPAAAFDAHSGHEVVAVRGTTNAVYVRRVDRGGGWASLGGKTYDGPGAGAATSGLALAVRGTDNHIYSRSLGSSWSPRWVRG